MLVHVGAHSVMIKQREGWVFGQNSNISDNEKPRDGIKSE